MSGYGIGAGASPSPGIWNTIGQYAGALLNTFTSTVDDSAEASAVGCADTEANVCPAGSHIPDLGPPGQYWSIRETIFAQDFDSGPVEHRWEAQSYNPPPIANCNRSTDGIVVHCDFGFGEGIQDFYYDENNYMAIRAMLPEEMIGSVACSFSFMDARSGEIIESTDPLVPADKRWIYLGVPNYPNFDEGCFYGTTPLMGNEDIITDPPHPVEGELVHFAYPAAHIRECDGSTDHIKVYFNINEVLYEATLNSDYYELDICLPAPEASGTPTTVNVEVHDTSRQDVQGNTAKKSTADLNPSKALGLYVETAVTEMKSTIYSTFSAGGAVANNPVELRLGFTEETPRINYTVEWRITRDGVDVPAGEQPANGEVTTFIPRRAGRYHAYATVSFIDTECETDSVVINREFSREIQPFSAPSIEIEGDAYPSNCSTESYRVLPIRTQWRPLGPEDDAATYTVRVYRPGTPGSLIPEDEERSLDTAFEVSWPPVSSLTIYAIEVTVNSPAYSEPAVQVMTVYLHPAAEADSLAALYIETDYPDRETYRPIRFTARPVSGAATYNWRIVEHNGTEFTPPISFDASGLEVEQVFTVQGEYLIELETLNAGGGVISTTRQPIRIYSFSPPEVGFNAPLSVFTDEDVSFFLSVDRSGGLVAEDLGATFTWSISHDEVQPDGSLREVDDSAALCRATGVDFEYGRVYSCRFDENRTYKIRYTIEGSRGAYTVDEVKFITVYPASTEAAFYVNTDYDNRIPRRVIEFVGREVEGAASYSWVITERNGEIVGTTIPGDTRAVSHTFSEDGTYTIQITAYDATDAEITSFADEIEIYPFPAPALALHADGEPLFSGGDSTFILNMARPGGLWSEDTGADITWRVFHNEPGGVEINHTPDCVTSALGREISCRFDEPGTYGVEYTVEGVGGSYERSGIKFFAVYADPASTDPRVNVAVEPATYGPFTGEFSFDASGSTASAGARIVRYTFDFGDGTPLETNADGAVSHTFPRAGRFEVIVTAQDSLGRESEIILVINPY